MQIVRLNCAFSRNLGRGDDVDGLGAIMRGILKTFLPKIKEVPFDKALPLLQREAWRLADKYDTDGANVINIMMKRFREIANE